MGCWEILENTGEPAISAKNRAVLSRKGFSLIEILMVVAIIAVLAGIAIPQLSRHRTRSYNTSAVADLKNAAIAQEAYFADKQQYCATLSALMSHPYNFFTSNGVRLGIVSASKTNYLMTASHSSGNVVYTLPGPGGSVVP